MHWPGPGRQLAFAPVTQTNVVDAVVVKTRNKNPDKVVPVPADWTSSTRLELYSQMCSAIHLGLTRSVGVCNFSLRQLEELVEFCHINQLPLPSVVQNEFHPHLHVHATPLIEYCQTHGITFQAHSSLGGPIKKRKKIKCDVSSLLTNAVVIKVAQDQNVPPATLLFRWGVSKGVTSVIAKSTNKTRIEENRKIFDDPFDVSVGGSEIDSLDLGHKGTTCFTWVRESDPDEY